MAPPFDVTSLVNGSLGTTSPTFNMDFNTATTPGVPNYQSVPTTAAGYAPAYNGVGSIPPASGGANDYLSQQRDLLSKYQAMADKAYPDNQLFGNSRFALNHPLIAGALNNAFLAASMTKQGSTIGENISNAAAGVLGAGQVQRDNMLKRTMLPEQMAMQSLALPEALAKMANLNASTANLQSEPAYRYGVLQHDQMRDDAYMASIMGRNPNMASLNQQVLLRKYGVNSIQDLTPAQAVSFAADLKSQTQRSMAGMNPNTAYAIIANPNSSADDIEMAHSFLSTYVGTQAAIGGGKTGAEQTAAHPQADTASFIETQKQNLFKDMPPVEKDFYKWYPQHATEYSDATKASAAHDQLIAKDTNDRRQRAANFAAYQQNEMKNRTGKPFNPDSIYMTPNSKAPTASSNRPTGW